MDKDETILWQGRPDTNIAFSAAHLPEIGFGLFFVGFALFWMIGASQAVGNFWMFGLIFFIVGLGLITRSNLLAAVRRGYTHYTLTNKRAIIATNAPLFGRSLKFYPITANTQLEVSESGGFGTVNFAQRVTNDGEGGQNINVIGFERLLDARAVYAMLRKIQINAVNAKGNRDA